MKKTIFILFILALSCKSKVVQYPVNYENEREKFMAFSQDRNKQILAEDNELIENYIKNSPQKFVKTSYGFWISNQGKSNEKTARAGDIVKYDYEVSSFDDQVIYSQKETGTQQILMGRADLPRGVHIALEMIEKGDSATVLLPSFLAFGGYGDRNKIMGNEPLIFRIHILDIQKK